MRHRLLLLGLRVSVLVALAASAGLLFDYLGTEVAYCATSGCLRVRRYGWVGGLVPVPALGVVAFGVLFAMSVARRLPGIARLAGTAAVTGGLIGGLLLLHQAWVVQAFCAYCVIVDLAAMAAGVAGAGLLWVERGSRGRLVPHAAETAGTAPEDPLRPGAWLALGVLAVVLPLLWPLLRQEPPVPAAIRAYYVADRINVVELSDFECSACRALHGRLGHLLAEYGERVHFVRLVAPLAAHPNSLAAATAAVCAEAQGSGEEMASALFRAETLEPSEIERMAAILGLDRVAFADCREDPETLARIRRERSLLELGGMPVTPKLYVGGTRIVGAQSDLVLRDALERAARGHDRRGLPGWAFGLLATLLGVGVVVVGWPRGPRRAAAARREG